MKLLSFAAAAALFLVAQSATAHEFKIGDLIIDHPMALETFQTAMTGAGYLSVTNTGSQNDRLIAVEADFPRVMLHTSETTNDIVTMSHLDGIDIPAGETVTLAPGGLHVMFMGLNGDPFEVGETFPATLVFEKAGRLDVVFNVEARDGATDEMDHSNHDAMMVMPRPFTMTFQAMADGSVVDCNSQIAGFGPDGTATIGINDLRFYVSDVTFYGADGAAVPATFDENEFQLVRDTGSVALIDLTSNESGSCAPGTISFGEGTARMNDHVTGLQTAGEITEVGFRIGLPQPLMQEVIVSGSAEDAPSPLNEMYWNWASGYRHFVLNHTVEIADGTYGEGYAHIGSRACGPAEPASENMSDSPEGGMTHGMSTGLALSDKDRCGFINTAEIRFPVNSGDQIDIALDINALLADLPFVTPVVDRATMETIGTQPGITCHSSPMQTDCPILFDAFGLNIANGTADAVRQTVFKRLP